MNKIKHWRKGLWLKNESIPQPCEFVARSNLNIQQLINKQLAAHSKHKIENQYIQFAAGLSNGIKN